MQYLYMFSFFYWRENLTASQIFKGLFLFWLIYSAFYLLLKNEIVDYFGFEYGNIAAAVARGEGFADAMETGRQQPTAWMPLLYVYLLAAVFYLTGIKSVAALWLLAIIRSVVLAWGCYLIYRIGSRLGKLQALTCTIAFISYITVFSYIMVSNIFTEEWLMAVLLLFLAHQFIALFSGEHLPTREVVAGAVLCTLASPILLAVWLGLSLVYIATGQLTRLLPENHRYLSYRIAWKPLGAATIAAVCLLSVWGIRNYYAMGKFIPLKSNVWMEVYLSNVISADGLLWADVLHGHHPHTNAAIRSEYSDRGEIAFLAAREKAAKTYLSANLSDYTKKIGNRLINAFVYTDLNNEPTALAHTPLKQHVRSLIIALIPALAMVIGLFAYGKRHAPVLLVLLLTYVGFLMPYVLISHFPRYQFFLIGLQAVFVGLAFSIFVVPITNSRRLPAFISDKVS